MVPAAFHNWKLLDDVDRELVHVNGDGGRRLKLEIIEHGLKCLLAAGDHSMTVSLEMSGDILDSGKDGQVVHASGDGADEELGMLNKTEVEVAKLDGGVGVQRDSSSILIGIRETAGHAEQ